MGLRFDLAITGYILLLPALILLILSMAGIRSKLFLRILFYFLLVAFGLSFLISAADIPYFNQFFKRFDVGAFEWIDSPAFVFKMIVREPRYFLAFLPFGVLTYLFYRGLRWIFRGYEMVNFRARAPLWLALPTSVLVWGLIFLAIRGRIQKKSPIRIGTAFFCEDPFLNQLGLNPVFTLMRSYLDALDPANAKVHLMPSDEAISLVHKYLDLPSSDSLAPLARRVLPDSTPSVKMNVVLVIMESMSAAKMGIFGNPDQCTPFLDSLSRNALFFDHIYTAGEHTFNGIFSTLFSFPALFRQHPLKTIRKYHGISTSLKRCGYKTVYFTTHDGQFDNVEGFLRANDFDRIITESDYPSREVKTTLGVPDDYMFRFAIPRLNQLDEEGTPFFAAFMTASDHGPYYLPPYFTPRHKATKKAIIEYADWALGKFVRIASHTHWFSNTLFVFIADHGAPIDVRYPVSLNYHHTPLIFYQPGGQLPAAVKHPVGSQIDVYPTIMGILRLPYVNTTMGIDLLQSRRPYALINGDDKVAALDTSFLLVAKGQQRWLYHYSRSGRQNIADSLPDKTREMERYLRAHLQVYQDLLTRGKTTAE